VLIGQLRIGVSCRQDLVNGTAMLVRLARLR
jgi:hypothetical protein